MINFLYLEKNFIKFNIFFIKIFSKLWKEDKFFNLIIKNFTVNIIFKSKIRWK